MSRGTPIETAIGTLYVTATSKNRVYVDGASNGKSVTIRGREYAVSAGVTRTETGEFVTDFLSHPGKDIYINRLGDYSPFPDIGKTIIVAARASIIGAAKRFMEQYPDELVWAEWRNWDIEMQRVKREIDEHLDKFNVAVAKYDALMANEPPKP